MSKQNREQTRTERAAAIRHQQERKERNKRVAIAAGIVVLLAAIVAVGVQYSRGGSTAPRSSKSPAATVGDHSLLVGNDENAKYRVVVYEDFLCPYCRQFEQATRDFLRQDAAEGKVLVEYRPFHLLQDPYSTRALNAWSAVLQKGTPAQALKFHDLLYDNQPYENASTKPDNAKLKALAKQAGVTDASVLNAFDTADTSFFTAVQTAAKKANVTGTPTILVNGKPLTGSSVDDEAANLEKLIAGS
ncbi:MAG: DsbA family protein [Marmoricola sp.]